MTRDKAQRKLTGKVYPSASHGVTMAYHLELYYPVVETSGVQPVTSVTNVIDRENIFGPRSSAYF